MGMAVAVAVALPHLVSIIFSLPHICVVFLCQNAVQSFSCYLVSWMSAADIWGTDYRGSRLIYQDDSLVDHSRRGALKRAKLDLC